MPPGCPRSPVFWSELKQRKWDWGALKKCFKDQLKQKLSQAQINHSGWERKTEHYGESQSRRLQDSLRRKGSWQQTPNVREESRQTHNPKHQIKSKSACAAPGPADPGLDYKSLHSVWSQQLDYFPVNLRIWRIAINQSLYVCIIRVRVPIYMCNLPS